MSKEIDDQAVPSSGTAANPTVRTFQIDLPKDMQASIDPLGFAPMESILKNLNRLFKDKWLKWEVETIATELGTPLSDLTSDKIHVLKILVLQPLRIYNDMAFTLYASEVINNKVANFEFLPTATSLELGYTLHVADRIVGVNNIPYSERRPSELVELATYILRGEGYSKPVPPLDFVPESNLEPGQTTEDTEHKAEAMRLYIEHMDSI